MQTAVFGAADCATQRSAQHEVVAVDQFGLLDEAQDGSDLGGGTAHDAARLGARIVDEAAGDLAIVRPEAGHDFTALELAHHLHDPDRQQALAFTRARPRRARAA